MRKEKGYTITEMMIVVAILGIIVSGFAVLITNLTRFWRLNLARTEVQREARRCLSLMNQNIRQAQASTVTIDQITSNPPWSRITFATIGTVTTSYYQDRNKLYQIVSGQTSMLAENLRSIAFWYPETSDTSIISISLCFEKATYEGGTKALQLSIEKVRIMN